MPSFRDLQPKDLIQVCLAGGFFPIWGTKEALLKVNKGKEDTYSRELNFSPLGVILFINALV